MLQPKKPVVKQTTKKTKSVSERLGDTTLRDVKNAGEDALQLVTLGGYGKAKKALGSEYKYKKIGEKKYGGKITKAKNGTSLGMKSVKAGFDKNPGVTRADIIVAGKGQARKGAVVKKAKSGSKVKKAFLGSLLGGVGKNLLGSVTSNLGGMLGGGGLGKMMGSLGKKGIGANTPSLDPMNNKSMKKGGSVKKKTGMHKMPNGSMMKNSKMKMGGKMAKQAATAIAMKKAGKTPKTMKSGGTMKKCKNGCK